MIINALGSSPFFISKVANGWMDERMDWCVDGWMSWRLDDTNERMDGWELGWMSVTKGTG